VIKTFELDFFKHNFEIKLASKHPHVAVEAPEKVAMNEYTFFLYKKPTVWRVGSLSYKKKFLV